MTNLPMRSLKRIHPLPSHLANQIAAGEVIERPASVLKEFLENSLDANSTQIEMTIERGGIGLIRVQDNGVGICKEDLGLALAPHATSKIETLSDLENVISYGFRGEALASIGAVSRLQLSSWVPDQEFGWSIHLAGRDAMPDFVPVPKRAGTIIEVRDLFYNTPARRKFLRSEKTETAYLEEIFKRIALSQPSVAFKFQQGDRLEKRLPICQDLEAHSRRVMKLCGQNFIKEAYYLQAESNGLILKGWLGSPKAMRSQADLQYFYVNGRIVRDKVVMHAIRQAYQEVSLPGRYPAYVLYFELDPASVDVNVHPTKHEVRFREARTVHAFLSYAVQEGLKQGSRPVVPVLKGMNEENNVKMDLSFLHKDVNHKDLSIDKEDQKSLVFNPPISELQTSIEKPLFVLGGELLFVENAEGLVIIDIKAQHRSLIIQQLTDAYQENGVSKRPLLMPKSITIKNSAQKLEASPINWAHLGFDITEIGQDLILVRSVPMVFGSQIEGLVEIMPILLACSMVEECIKYIADYIIKKQVLTEEEIKQIWVDIKKSDIPMKNNKNSKFYKQISIEKLRAILLS